MSSGKHGTEVEAKATNRLRTAHLLRLERYVNIAMIGMWMRNERSRKTIGMALACAGERPPGGADEEMAACIRELLAEARDFYDKEAFAPTMTRLRVAADMCSLRVIELSGE